MDRTSLAECLRGLKPGASLNVTFSDLEDAFPPGVEDDGAKQRCLQFAQQHDCHIDNQGAEGEVRFVKNA